MRVIIYEVAWNKWVNHLFDAERMYIAFWEGVAQTLIR